MIIYYPYCTLWKLLSYYLKRINKLNFCILYRLSLGLKELDRIYVQLSLWISEMKLL